MNCIAYKQRVSGSNERRAENTVLHRNALINNAAPYTFTRSLSDSRRSVARGGKANEIAFSTSHVKAAGPSTRSPDPAEIRA